MHELVQDVDPIILSVGEKDEISIADAARAIKEAMQLEVVIYSMPCTFRQAELTFGDESQDGQYKKTADNGRMMRLFPDFTFTPFPDAIRASCTWFIANYDMARK